MEKFQPSPFLVTWHLAMLIGTIIMFSAGFLILVYHHVKIMTLKTPKEKFDFISKREIKNFELTFIFFAIAAALWINRYGMDKLEEVSVVFFVRLFISIAGGTLVGYVAFLVLQYYYPTQLDKKLKKWRYAPRTNPKNGNAMRLLSEHEEDVHLDSGMKAEEDVFSVDYDVWVDEKTNDVLIEKYQGHLQALQCGNCGFYTLRVVREEITREATSDEPGELIKHYVCSYCKSVRATAFKISTKEGDDYKMEKAAYQNKENQDILFIKIEIKTASAGTKYFEFSDLNQAKKFLNEVAEP